MNVYGPYRLVFYYTPPPPSSPYKRFLQHLMEPECVRSGFSPSMVCSSRKKTSYYSRLTWVVSCSMVPLIFEQPFTLLITAFP